jgi:PIN domain nuclease of toxin-antitoxin system
VVICDTCALLFDALSPERIPARARRLLDEATAAGDVACADISLWEVAMLVQKGRVQIPVSLDTFLPKLLALRDTQVLPITPAIATRSVQLEMHGDPADRLIVATALEKGVPLITADRAVRDLPGLEVVWR